MAPPAAWSRSSRRRPATPGSGKRFFQGIDQALASKGLTRVTPDQSPELLVAVHGWAINRIDVQSYGYNYAATPYGSIHHGHARDGGAAVPGRYVDHRPGRRESKQMVWRGTATDTFSPGMEAQKGCRSRFEDAGGISAAEVTRRDQRVSSTMNRAGGIAPRRYSATPGSQSLISLHMEQSLSEPA